MRHRYHQADRKQKTEIIEGFVTATGYNRTYAAWILARAKRGPGESPNKRNRHVYDKAVRQSLISVWNAASQICSKRLAPFLPEFVRTLG
jgi:hypothetical protein